MKKKRRSAVGVVLAMLLALLSPFAAFAEDVPEALTENDTPFVFVEPEIPIASETQETAPVLPETQTEAADNNMPQVTPGETGDNLPQDTPEVQPDSGSAENDAESAGNIAENNAVPAPQQEVYIPKEYLTEENLEILAVNWEFPQDAFLAFGEPELEPEIAAMIALRAEQELEENETALYSRYFYMNVSTESEPVFQPFFGLKFMVRLRLEGDDFTPETLTDVVLLKNDGTAERLEEIDVQPWFLLDEDNTHGVDLVFEADEFCPFAVMSVYAATEDISAGISNEQDSVSENGDTDDRETEPSADGEVLSGGQKQPDIVSGADFFGAGYSVDNEALILEILDLLKDLPPDQAAAIVAAFEYYDIPSETADPGTFEPEVSVETAEDTGAIAAKGISCNSNGNVTGTPAAGKGRIIRAKKLSFEELSVLGEIWAAGSTGEAVNPAAKEVSAELEEKVRSFSADKLLALRNFLSANAAQTSGDAPAQQGGTPINLSSSRYSENCGFVLEYRIPGESDFKTADASTVFSGSEELQLTVFYSDIDALWLKQAGYIITYQADLVLSVKEMSGSVVSGSETAGIIRINGDGLATLTFDPEWVDSRVAHDAFEKETEGRKLSGNFKMRAVFNPGVISADPQQEHRVGGMLIRMAEPDNVFAENVPVTVKNEAIGLRRDSDGHYYLDFRVTAAAGEYGCSEGKIEITFTENARYAEYYMYALASDSGSETASLSPRDASDEKPAGMTWTLGTMEPGEERILNYPVRVTADYAGNKAAPTVKNSAEFYAGQFLRDSDVAEYCEEAAVKLTKTASDARRGDEGNYLIEYIVTAEADPDNPYDLTNVSVSDSLEGTDEVLLDYLSYECISIELPDGAPGYPSVYPTEESKAFEALIPLMSPGDTAEIKYTVRAQKDIESLTDTGLKVNNRAQTTDHSGTDGEKGASYSVAEKDVSLTGDGNKEYGSAAVTVSFPYGVQPGNYVFGLYSTDGENETQIEKKEVQIDQNPQSFAFERLEQGVEYRVYEMQPAGENDVKIGSNEIFVLDGKSYRAEYESSGGENGGFILTEDSLQAEVRITNELLTEIIIAEEFKGAKPESAAAYRFGIWDHDPESGDTPLQEQTLIFDPANPVNMTVFSGLSFDTEYFIFELDDSLGPVRHGNIADINGIDTHVEYSPENGRVIVSAAAEEPAVMIAENEMFGSIVLETTFSNMRDPGDNFKVYFRINEVTENSGNEDAGTVETPLSHAPYELSSSPYSHTWSDLQLGKTYRVYEVWQNEDGQFINANDNDVIVAENEFSSSDAFRTTYNGGEGNSDITLTVSEPEAVLRVDNFMVTNVTLPESGGPGTYAFYISGSAAILAAVIMILRKKSREK